LSLRDSDLISIQEARQLCERASAAQETFALFSQAQVDAVVEVCAHAATEAGEQLARAAVEETGYGNVADKVAKNRFASVDVHRAIRDLKTTGIVREDKEKGIVEVATPVGVVAAIIPCTNPTSTAIYKTLISLKARNAIVMSPHPRAVRCICETAGVMARAALRAGAPDGLIGCLGQATMPGTQELMRHRAVGVILATGGAGLVRAAYSSGKPAYGVGPGNVPAYIERTANVRKAVGDIFAGKTFDYGTICSSEQAIVADSGLREQVIEECRQQGGYFLTAEEIRRVGEVVIAPGSRAPNPEIVGRAATVIAEMAGIQVPQGTRVLIAQLDGVGREYPLSAEKLSPILAFYSAANLAEAIGLCRRILRLGGMGHTCAIHSQNEAAVREFGEAVPAFRVCVNTSAVHGSIGYSTNLFPAMTLGCGALGGNITSDNIGPQHLMNLKRIAWESRAVEHRSIPAERRLAGVGGASGGVAEREGGSGSGAATMKKSGEGAAAVAAAGRDGSGVEAETIDRQMIARIVERVFQERGIARIAPQDRGSASGNPAAGAAEDRGAPAAVAAGNAGTAVRGTSPLMAAPQAGPSAEAGGLSAAAAASATADIRVAEFVCESDVRQAISHDEKIFIGPKTIVTPAARDLANEHGVLVETKIVPADRVERR
jgi:acetaldehyde dehydrogenase (acetylating)